MSITSVEDYITEKFADCDPMKRKSKAKWLKHLRSGKYTQGKKVLKDSGKNYCCLGVLCEAKNLDSVKETEEDEGYIFSFKDSVGDRFLPETFRKKMRISKETQMALSILNDKRNLDFNQIADIIEKYL